jgi:hypothetical protein
MTIKQLGGVFGRNPTFNDVTIEGELTFDGDIDISSDLKIDGNLEVTGTSKLTGNVGIGIAPGSDALTVNDANGIPIRFGDIASAPVSQTACYVGASTSGLSGANGDLVLVPRTSDSRSILFYTGSGASALAMNVGANKDVTIAAGNLVIGTSGSGIDFSATGQAPGMTSELLDDYEEGTWTPIDSSGAGLTFTASSGSYTKVGRMVMATGFVNFPVTADGSNNKIGGLPFANIDSTSRGVGAVNYKQVADVDTLLPENNATTFFFATATGSSTTNAQISNTAVYFGLVYTAS